MKQNREYRENPKTKEEKTLYFINVLPKPSNISNETHYRSQNKILAGLDELFQNLSNNDVSCTWKFLSLKPNTKGPNKFGLT